MLSIAFAQKHLHISITVSIPVQNSLRDLAGHSPELYCKLSNRHAGNFLKYKALGDPARD